MMAVDRERCRKKHEIVHNVGNSLVAYVPPHELQMHKSSHTKLYANFVLL